MMMYWMQKCCPHTKSPSACFTLKLLDTISEHKNHFKLIASDTLDNITVEKVRQNGLSLSINLEDFDLRNLSCTSV